MKERYLILLAQSALCERWYQWKPAVQTSYAPPFYAEMLWIREGLSIYWIHQALNQVSNLNHCKAVFKLVDFGSFYDL